MQERLGRRRRCWCAIGRRQRARCAAGGLAACARGSGHLIQAQLETLSERPLFGWKIAATSEAGQRHIGIDRPIAGRLLVEMVHADDAEIPFGGNRMRVAKAEFAFRTGRDLPPCAAAYGREEVLATVSALLLAIEIPDSRFADFVTAGLPQLVADNACGHCFVLGPEAPAAWRGLDLAAQRVTARAGGRAAREGIGANVLGDPRIALTWLANEVSGIGAGLRVGQVVTTGTCLMPLEIGPGDVVSVDYGVLGRIGCRLAVA